MIRNLFNVMLIVVCMLSLPAYTQELHKNNKTGFNFTGLSHTANSNYSLNKNTKSDQESSTKKDTNSGTEETTSFEAGWRTTQYRFETGFYVSRSKAFQTHSIPFWLRTNQFGIVPKGPVAAVVQGSIYTDYRSQKPGTVARKLDFGYGLDVVINSSMSTPQILIPEAYVKMRLGPVEMYGGRRREVVGLMDTLLTSGSYIWSGNALPIPKVEISLPDYWPANSFIGVKGTYSHGFFENSRPFVKDGRLHQKSLYVRLGKSRSPIRLYGGINHQVQWGGYSPFYSTDGKLPSSPQAYMYVVTAMSVAGDSLKFGNSFDGGNRVGNHLGSVDVAMQIKLAHSSLLLYRQSIYEDGSLFRMASIADGLNGISWQTRNKYKQGISLQRLTLEYLYTMNQGGAVFVNHPAKLRGKDNYFNHAQYRDGWSYYGRTIGTPFITANMDLKEGVPVGGFFTSNNRVQVWHLGAAGRLSEAISFMGKVSYSHNAGTYDVAFDPMLSQMSAYLGIGADVGFWSGVQISGAVGWDQGQLLNDALGMHLKIRKTWIDRYKREIVQNKEGSQNRVTKR